MKRDEVLSELKNIIKDVVSNDIDFDLIDENCNLTNDLGFDSISLLMVAVAIEEKFGVQVENMTSDDFKTVGDVIDFILVK